MATIDNCFGNVKERTSSAYDLQKLVEYAIFQNG